VTEGSGREEQPSLQAAAGLNDNHRRALLVAFVHIDGLLAEMEAAAEASRSPFPTLVPDLSNVQRQVLGDYLAQLRAKMVA